MCHHRKKAFILLVVLFLIFSGHYAFSQVNAGKDTAICTSSYTLSAISENGVWSTSGGATIVNPSSQITSVTNLDPGENTFTYTVSGLGTDDVIVTNNQIIADAGTDVTSACSSTTTLNGSAIPSGGSGEWSLLLETPGVIIDNTALASTTVQHLPFGNTIFVWTVSANGCTDSDEVSINNNIPENDNGTDKTGCTNIFYIGAENPPSGGSGEWTNVSGPGVTFDNINNPAVEIDAAIGTSTVRWTITYSGCTSSKDFIVTNNLPDPNAGADIPTCVDTVDLDATPLQSGESGVWSVIGPQGEVFSNASIHNPTVTNVKQGTTSFVWLVSNINCSLSDTVRVTNNRPDVYAGPDDVICTSGYTLNANNPTPNTGEWTCSDPGVTFGNSNQYNSTVSGMENDTYTFTWTVSNGTCDASDQVEITCDYVTITAGSDISDCSSSFSLSATTIPPGGSGYWTKTFGDGTIDNSLSPSTTVNDVTSTSRFRWTIISGSCTYYDDIELVNQLPSQATASANKAVCTTQTLITATPPIGQNEDGIWSVEGTGSAVIQVPSLFQTQVTNLAPGVNTFRWTIYNQNCSTYDLMEVTNNQITTSAGADDNTCSTDYTLNASLPSGTGYWTSSNPSVVFVNSTSPDATATNLSFGMNTLYWTRNDVGCSVNDTVVITNNLPNHIYAGDNQVVCQDQTTLFADNPSHGTGAWSVVNGSGTFTNNTQYQTAVNGVSLGINTYRWTVTYESCTVSDDMQVSNNRIVIDAGDNQVICNQYSANLQGTEPAVGQSGIWTIVGGQGVFDNQTLYNSGVDGLVKGINTYRWTVADSYCTNYDEVTITNNTPDSAKVIDDLIICTDNTAISAIAVTNGTGSWSVASGAGTFDNASNNNTNVTYIGSGTNVYRWTVTKNGCSLSADLQVDNNSVNAQITAEEIPICQASHSTTLTAIDPTEPGASGTWTKISTGSGTIESPNNHQTVVSNLANGDIRFRWTVQNTDCSSYDEVVVVNNYYTPSAAPVGSSSVCDENIGIIGNAPPPSGGGQWTANSPSVTFDNPTSANTYARSLPVGTTTITWTLTNDGCFASTNFNVTNNSLTVSAGEDIVGCASTQVLNADDLSAGQTGYWVANNASVTFTDDTDPKTTANNIPQGSSQLTWTITANGCSANDAMTLINNSFSVSAGNDQIICGTTYTLSGSDPLSNGTGNWSVIEGNGVFADPASNVSNVSNVDNGANTYRWTVTRNSCVATDDVVITNDLYVAQASAPEAVCVDEVVVTAETLPAASGASGTWTTLYGGGVFDNANDYETTARGLSLGANRFRWTVTKGSCTSSVNVDVMNNRVNVSAGNDQVTCETTTTLFASLLSGTASGEWTCDISTVNIESPNEPLTNITNLSRGANTFTWSVTNLGCAGDDIMVVTNNAFDANAGVDQEVTVSGTDMTAELPAGATGNWTLVTGNGIFSNYSEPTATVSNLGYGANTFRWTVTSNGCIDSDDVEIIYNVAEAWAGYDQVSCNDYATLAADQPAMGTGTWSVVQGAGTFVEPNSYNTQVTNVGRGVNIYRWTVTAFEVSASDDVNITNNTFDISAGEDQATCDLTVELNAETPGAGGAGTWAILGGSAVFSNITDNNTTVSDMHVGGNLYVWRVDRNGCTATDTVQITHYQPVTESNAGEDAFICNDNQYNISANQPDYGIGTWSCENSEVTFDNEVHYNTMVRNLANGSNTLLWTISNDHCESVDTVVISSFTDVEIVDQPVSQEITENGLAVFNVSISGNAESYQWMKDNETLTDDERISGANTADLQITGVINEDAGGYRCFVYGYCNTEETYQVTLSVISGLEDLTKNGIKIYPNPSKGILNLEFEQTNGLKDVTIARLSGERVFHKQLINKKEMLDLSHLADGIYLVYFQYGNELLKTKIIIQK